MYELQLKISTSDYISIVAVLINLALAIWIVRTLQNSLTNKRYLKTHFIDEIKKIQEDYRSFLDSLYSKKLKPKEIIPWFKLMNIQIQDLMSLIKEKYKLDKDPLKNYHTSLRLTITELDEFIENYNDNNEIELGKDSLEKIIKFQQDNNSEFNKLIVKINDFK